MKTYVERHPVAFSLLLALVLFGLWSISMAALPRTPVSNVADLPPELRTQLSDQKRALLAVASSENLFRVLTILLAVVLLKWLGWWREAGFNRPSRWQNPYLLLFPLLVAALTLSGGIRFSGSVFLASLLFGALLTAFSEEVLFRGIMWRAMVPTGVLRAVVVTSLLSGALLFGRLALSGPWPEALLVTMLAMCAGFTYAVLRWRTASIWPAVLVHFAFALAGGVSMLPLVVLVGTLGLVGYGLFLLRRVRTGGSGSTFC